MKKKLKILSVAISGSLFSQVTVGKTTPSMEPANVTVSLEFGNATVGSKGIVLPWISSAENVTTPVPGTLIFDSADQKIKFGKATTSNAAKISGWGNLSDGAYAPVLANLPDESTENANAKALIGGVPETDTTSGILVLGDVNKAMILPRINSFADIINPSAGMMVYITGTTPHHLAFYNGREWSFWTKQP